MIILRQKEYSKKTKVLYALEAARNGLEQLGANAHTAVTEAVHGKLSPKTISSQQVARLMKKNKKQLIKQTIIDKKKIEDAISPGGRERAKMKVKAKALDKTVSVLDKANKGVNYLKTHTPGEVVAEIPEKVLDKGLIATTGTVGGYVMPAVGAGYIPGTTAMSLGAESAVRKALPGYAKWSEQSAQKYKHGKLKKIIRTAGDLVAQSPLLG